MVVGTGYVISYVYIVYLTCDSLVILLYCTIVKSMKEKIEGLQGSEAHMPILVYPLLWGSTQGDVV